MEIGQWLRRQNPRRATDTNRYGKSKELGSARLACSQQEFGARFCREKPEELTCMGKKLPLWFIKHVL